MNSANNGLFPVVAGSGATSIKVATGTLVAETLPDSDPQKKVVVASKLVVVFPHQPRPTSSP